MKYIELSMLLLGLTFFGCNHAESKTTARAKEKIAVPLNDKEKIQNLMRQVYEWHETQILSNNDMLSDEKDSIYIGFNLDQLKQDIENLKETSFFSNEFLENYYKIYTTLDKKLRNKEIEWLVGDLPPFGNDANPWCNCQDTPDNYWHKMTLKILHIESNKATFTWTWGDNFEYKARAVRENNFWKIAYLQGFDFKEMTKKKY